MALGVATAKALARYNRSVDRTRPKRMKWWKEARFGLFITWGPYAMLGRHEVGYDMECMPPEEYERLVARWRPKPRAPREWIRLAKQAGMKYAVLVAKHGDGFCLWDSKATDYNAMQIGPRRDLVREYVDACREYGLRVGIYYCVPDLHFPDSMTDCVRSLAARERYTRFTRQCVRELMTNYGRIDILWYDGGWIFDDAEQRSLSINRMVRRLQPRIILNDRAMLPEDFTTPEGSVAPAQPGREWEACMTFNGASWGYMPAADVDAWRARDILRMLHVAAAAQGNLLLNIGPGPDGSVPRAYHRPLADVGRWLERHGEAVYGAVDRVPWIKATATSTYTLKGRTLYVWVRYWPGRELPLGGFTTRLLRASFLADGKPVAFQQKGPRIVLTGLPQRSPDPATGVTVLKLDFAGVPHNVKADWERRLVAWAEVAGREKEPKP